jgi:hypothetical protein
MGGWDDGLLPGPAAALRRMEQQEAARAAEAAALAQEKADERYERWFLRRSQELAWQGKPFNPADPKTMIETEQKLLDRVWAAMDAQDRREYRRHMVASGEWADLGVRFVGDVTPGAASTNSLPPPPASRAAIQSKARHALRRWSADRRTAARKAAEAKEYR